MPEKAFMIEAYRPKTEKIASPPALSSAA